MTDFRPALPEMQDLASRAWHPDAWQHAGQLAWSSLFAADDSEVQLWHHDGRPVAWGWREDPAWVEWCVDPGHPHLVAEVAAWAGPGTSTLIMDGEPGRAAWEAAGFAEVDRPWFTQHTLDLATLRSPGDVGCTLRHVGPGEVEQRAACHRAAWSDDAPSQVSDERYERLTRTPPYDARLDWIAIAPDGEWVASVLVWLAEGVALVEPVGVVPGHRGRRIAGALSLAALAAARDLGAHTGLVRPRGDDDYPVPMRVYRAIGFEPRGRSHTLSHG